MKHYNIDFDSAGFERACVAYMNSLLSARDLTSQHATYSA